MAATLCSFFFAALAHSQEPPKKNPQPFASRNMFPRSADEQTLLDDANRERASQGLQPLHWDATLALAAREHARLMAVENVLSHRLPGEPPLEQRGAQVGARFSMIAENVAVGLDPESIHEGWMHSPGHRKNILNAELSAVGIATMRGSGGLFAVQDFSRPVANLTLQQEEGKVISLLKETAWLGVNVSEDARKTCGTDRGFTGATALYVIRFEVTNLDKLPDELLQKIRSGKYRYAEVGACRGGDAAGFTRYRLAVMLH